MDLNCMLCQGVIMIEEGDVGVVWGSGRRVEGDERVACGGR